MQVCSGNELTWTAPLYAAARPLDLAGIDEADEGRARRDRSRPTSRPPSRTRPTPTSAARPSTATRELLHDRRSSWATPSRPTTLRQKRHRAARPLDRARRVRHPQRVLLRLRRDATGHRRATPVVRLGRVQRPPLPLRLLPVRRGGAGRRTTRRWREQLAPVMDLLAADIAATPANELLPGAARASTSTRATRGPPARRRSPTATTRSRAREAVTAWTGLALWAKASGNDALRDRGHAGCRPRGAGRPGRTGPNFDNDRAGLRRLRPLDRAAELGRQARLRHLVLRRSRRPMLAILLIPMSPSSDHLGGRSRADHRQRRRGHGSGDFDQQFGDYLLMYSALGGRGAAQAPRWRWRRTLADEWIDDGNTRTYLLAFLASLRGPEHPGRRADRDLGAASATSASLYGFDHPPGCVHAQVEQPDSHPSSSRRPGSRCPRSRRGERRWSGPPRVRGGPFLVLAEGTVEHGKPTRRKHQHRTADQRPHPRPRGAAGRPCRRAGRHRADRGRPAAGAGGRSRPGRGRPDGTSAGAPSSWTTASSSTRPPRRRARPAATRPTRSSRR